MLSEKDCLVSMVHFLHRAAEKEYHMPIPMSQVICYEHHFPRGWYVYEKPDGGAATGNGSTATAINNVTMTRLPPKECDTVSIRAAFGRKKPGVLCAQVIHRDDRGKVLVEYKDKRALEAFLLNPYELCLLSQFITPKKNALGSNDAIVAMWTPSVFQVEQWASRAPLADESIDVQTRGDTFKPGQCTELLCAPLLARKAKECLQFIVDLVYRMERRKVVEIRGIFKQSANTQLWLQWVESVRFSTGIPPSLTLQPQSQTTGTTSLNASMMSTSPTTGRRTRRPSPLPLRERALTPQGVWPSFCAPDRVPQEILARVEAQMAAMRNKASSKKQPAKPRPKLLPVQRTADPVVPLSQQPTVDEPVVTITYTCEVPSLESLCAQREAIPHTPPPTPRVTETVPPLGELMSTSLTSATTGISVARAAVRDDAPSKLSVAIAKRYRTFRSELRACEIRGNNNNYNNSESSKSQTTSRAAQRLEEDRRRDSELSADDVRRMSFSRGLTFYEKRFGTLSSPMSGKAGEDSMHLSSPGQSVSNEASSYYLPQQQQLSLDVSLGAVTNVVSEDGGVDVVAPNKYTQEEVDQMLSDLRDVVYSWYCEQLTNRTSAASSRDECVSGYFHLPLPEEDIPVELLRNSHVSRVGEGDVSADGFSHGIVNVTSKELVDYGNALCSALDVYLRGKKVN